MAMKRCPDCGEKYSDSYKYCPFCEEEEILKEGKGRGVRRAKQSRSFSLLTPVLIVLILVMAGLLMFLLRSDKQPTEPVTPQPGVETPAEPGTDTEPGSTDSDGTDSTDPGTMPDEPDSNTPSTPTTPDTSSDTSAAGKAKERSDYWYYCSSRCCIGSCICSDLQGRIRSKGRSVFPRSSCTAVYRGDE